MKQDKTAESKREVACLRGRRPSVIPLKAGGVQRHNSIKNDHKKVKAFMRSMVSSGSHSPPSKKRLESGKVADCMHL